MHFQGWRNRRGAVGLVRGAGRILADQLTLFRPYQKSLCLSLIFQFERTEHNLNHPRVTNFLKPVMFCHLAVLIYLCGEVRKKAKLQIPSPLNIDLILWQKMLNHCLNHGVFLSLFKLISCPTGLLPHTLNYMCLSLSKFHIQNQQFQCCPKWLALPRRIKV